MINTTGQKHATDVIIIGAGPVGLFAVFELGLLDMKCILIDILDRVGGQCAELYPEKPIYDIPALPIVTGAKLTDNLMEQIKPFGPNFLLGQMANHLTRLENGHWQVTTDQGQIVTAPVVMIAGGGGSFTPKKMPLPNADTFENRSLFYAVRDRNALTGKNIVIAGGGDSAIDWLLDLYPIARHITLTHRRDDFRAAPANVTRMRELVQTGAIDLQIGHITALTGTEGQLKSITLKTQEDHLVDLMCDQLLVFYGLTMKPGPIAEFGLDLDQGLIIVDTEKFETSQPGVFAIGDICTYPGKLKLILSGFHEGALAAQAAFRYVYPDKKLRFQYTTASSELHKKLGVS